MLVAASRSALRRSLPRSLPSARNGSSSAHHDHHEESGQDYSVPEGFGSTIWRNTALFGLAAVAFYKFAPTPSDDVFLTRWMAMYAQSKDHLLDINAKHTALSQASADQILLFHDAQKPVVRRFRYPQGLGQASPFLIPVGQTVDFSDINVKKDSDISF